MPPVLRPDQGLRETARVPLLRPAELDDLPACAEVWRAALTDYGVGVGRPPLPPTFGPLLELLGHLHTTDPDRFVVATRPGRAGDRTVAFGSAVVRGSVWFLSMLFVLPDAQGAGLGRRILERIMPGPGEDLVCATCTDSAQPISNALYSRYGIVPRVPILELVGVPDPSRLPDLPPGIVAAPFGAPGPADRLGAPDPFTSGPEVTTALDAIDRATLGYAHPADHGFLARTGRRGFLFRTAAGDPVGYGYAAPSGRLGPVATLEPDLVARVFGHLVRSVPPLGASSAWVPGSAGEAIHVLLQAGMRIEDFPALLCWDRPFADFERYVPITLAVL